MNVLFCEINCQRREELPMFVYSERGGGGQEPIPVGQFGRWQIAAVLAPKQTEGMARARHREGKKVRRINEKEMNVETEQQMEKEG